MLGIIQEAILECDVISITTTSPNPETAVAIISAIAILLSAAIAVGFVWIRRAGNTSQKK